MAEERQGPRVLDAELHERIRQLKIATEPHPSNMLLNGRSVLPLVNRSEVTLTPENYSSSSGNTIT